jgi:hypothetical protein
MQDKLWFRAKMYGWGWYPITWQGWAITLLYVLTLVAKAKEINKAQHTVSDFLINFGFQFIILTILLLTICYLKGEKPEWRWEGKKI